MLLIIQRRILTFATKSLFQSNLPPRLTSSQFGGSCSSYMHLISCFAAVEFYSWLFFCVKRFNFIYGAVLRGCSDQLTRYMTCAQSRHVKNTNLLLQFHTRICDHTQIYQCSDVTVIDYSAKMYLKVAVFSLLLFLGSVAWRQPLLNNSRLSKLLSTHFWTTGHLSLGLGQMNVVQLRICQFCQVVPGKLQK